MAKNPREILVRFKAWRAQNPSWLSSAAIYILAACVVIFVVQCNNHENKKYWLDVEMQESKFQDLQDQATALAEECERFDSEDWKMVVPEVRAKAEALKDDLIQYRADYPVVPEPEYGPRDPRS